MFRSRKSFLKSLLEPFRRFAWCQMIVTTHASLSYIGYRSGVSWQLILTVYIEALKGTEFSFLILNLTRGGNLTNQTSHYFPVAAIYCQLSSN